MEKLEKIVDKSMKYPGVYAILNTTNNKCYVGSTKNVYTRTSLHLSHLFKNKHHSITLQRAYNKYGKDAFKIILLAKCPDEKFYLEKLENKFIQILNSEYNILKSAYRNYNCKGSPKITETQVIDIITEYQNNTKITYKIIAEKYNIAISTVHAIIRGNNWKNIKGDISNIPGNRTYNFNTDEIEVIANLYNSGRSSRYIATEIFNDITKTSAICKMVKGVSYKEYSYLFDKSISYVGKRSRNGKNKNKYSEQDIINIAELYNKGVNCNKIGRELFNDHKAGNLIAAITRGLFYKEYSNLFNKKKRFKQ